MSTITQIGLIADDFTGAMDSGAQFASSRLSVHFRFTGQPEGDVEIINTASREIDQSEAVARNLDACRLLKGRLLFKKIDSTLRGHVSAEVGAILSASNYRKAVICPAAPLQGRTVLDGMIYVNGILLAETSFKNDPIYPAKTSRISELIQAPTTHLSLELVRSPLEQLSAAITSADQPLITADAETPHDLLALARAVLVTNSLPCGAFGLANAYLQSLNLDVEAQPPYRPVGPVLVLIGSASQVAREQAGMLESHPDSLVLRLDSTLTPDTLNRIFDMLSLKKRILVLCAAEDKTIRSPEWLRFGKTVSELGQQLLKRFQPQTIIVVGGETVTYFCGLAQAESIQILGEVSPGIPYGRIQGGELDQHILITKAGGFGDPNTFAKILFM